jgi:hypothetical protein
VQVADQVTGERVDAERATQVLGSAAVDVGVFVDRPAPAFLDAGGLDLEWNTAERGGLEESQEVGDGGRRGEVGDRGEASHM